MRSNKLKKIIASTLLLSSAFMIGASVMDKSTKVVHADDWDDYDDYYDDDYYDHDYDEVFGGNISISGTTTHYGLPAVTIQIPNGMRVVDVDVDREPHDGIEEMIMGNKVVIYGLRPGFNYNGLMLKLEDSRGIDHKYVINGFNVSGGNNVTPQPPVNPPVNPPAPPVIPPQDGIYGDDVFKGNIAISGTTSYLGRPAVTIQIPDGMRIVEADVDNEPHDGIEEIVMGNKVTIFGLRPGIKYAGLMLKLEDMNGIDYKYMIDPFSVGGTPVKPGQPTDTVQKPTLPNGGHLDANDIFEGNISISGVTQHLGRPAVEIAIPNGMRVVDVDVDGEPHDGVEDIIKGKKVVIYGLRKGVQYTNLVLSLEDTSGRDHKYVITPFNVGGVQDTNTPSNTQKPVAPPSTADRTEVKNYLDKIYENVFDREGDADGLTYWTQQLSDKNISLLDFFKNLLSEDEFLNLAPSTQDKILKLYEGIFQRQPDGEGFNFWVNRYNQELARLGNEKVALTEIINQMTNGDEFRGLVRRLGLD